MQALQMNFTPQGEGEQKVRKERKKKLEIQYCTKEQRQERVKQILQKLFFRR